MKYLSKTDFKNKRVLLRTDYNVSLTPHHRIADDNRIKASLPTIKNILEKNNRLIILTHLGRPEGIDPTLTLEPVRKRLKELLPDYNVKLVSDFQNKNELFENQTPRDILLLENIRFFKEEDKNDTTFAKKLSALGDVFVNDAFSVDHRKAASIVGIPLFLPSYAGILLEKEFNQLSSLLSHPAHPFVALVGGGKISTKLTLLEHLLQKVDTLLVGGGIATTCLHAKGLQIGKSISEPRLLSKASTLLSTASNKLILPIDVVVEDEQKGVHTRIVTDIQPDEVIRDIGPQTVTLFETYLRHAQTILWNGPVGFFETPPFDKGTEKVYEIISKNTQAIKIVGGGDSLAALSKDPGFEKHFTHVSTGGGAMLEFLEKGSLPGIDALDENDKTLL